MSAKESVQGPTDIAGNLQEWRYTYMVEREKKGSLHQASIEIENEVVTGSLLPGQGVYYRLDELIGS